MADSFRMSPGAVRKLLTDPGTARAVTAAAQRIAAAAGPGMETRPLETGRNRVRMAVVTVTYQARLAEARNRALTRAVGAGRG